MFKRLVAVMQTVFFCICLSAATVCFGVLNLIVFHSRPDRGPPVDDLWSSGIELNTNPVVTMVWTH